MQSIKEILNLLKETKHYLVDTENKVVLSREQIGETISANYTEAVEALESSLFMDAFEAGDADMAQKLHTIEGKYSKSEQILFHLQYELNPNLPFSYREIIYRDVKTMGETILKGKAEREVILEAMKLKMFSFYARYKQLDQARSDIIELVEFAENYIYKSVDIAYYLLGYYLSDRKYYKYDGHKFVSVVTLYTYLTEKKRLKSFSNTADDDILFIAWIYALGNYAIYEKWSSEVHRIDELNYEVFNNKTIEKKKAKKEVKPVEKKVKKETELQQFQTVEVVKEEKEAKKKPKKSKKKTETVKEEKEDTPKE